MKRSAGRFEEEEEERKRGGGDIVTASLYCHFEMKWKRRNVEIQNTDGSNKDKNNESH